MGLRKLRHLLLVGGGLGLITGPAAAQEDCAGQIDAFRADAGVEEMPAGQQERVESLLQGAREFAEQGEQQACRDTLAQLRDLVSDEEEVVIAGGRPGGAQQPAASGQQQSAARTMPPMPEPKAAQGDDASAADIPQPERRPADMGRSDDDRGGQQAQVGEQETGGEAQQVLERAQQQVQQAREAQQQQAEQQAQQGERQEAQDKQQEAQESTAADGDPDAPRSEPQAKYGPLAWLSFDDMIGAEVHDQDGATVAEIIGLVRDRQAGNFFAVLDSGGGGDMVVPVDRLELGEGEQIALSSGADQAMQPFEQGDYEQVR